MKKLINAVAGDGKNTSPARKYAVYAALITAIALALALIILVVSSVVIALTDGGADNAPTGGDNASADNDGGSVTSGAVQYKTVTADELAAEIDGLVDFTSRADREIESGTNNLYYAKKEEVKKLSAGAMDALDGMLKDFYKNNKDKLNTDIGANRDNPECDIPLIVEETADGLSFKIVVFGDDKTTFNNEKYSWIYDNAHKYGFICNENTFTYVGTAVSTHMNSKKLATVDALITALNGKPVSVKFTEVGASKATQCQIYYLAADGELKVPTNYEYEVIANGSDGYFVIINTAKKIATASTDTAAE